MGSDAVQGATRIAARVTFWAISICVGVGAALIYYQLYRSEADEREAMDIASKLAQLYAKDGQAVPTDVAVNTIGKLVLERGKQTQYQVTGVFAACLFLVAIAWWNVLQLRRQSRTSSLTLPK